MDELDDYGPSLQVKMFALDRTPDAAAVEAFADEARREAVRVYTA